MADKGKYGGIIQKAKEADTAKETDPVLDLPEELVPEIAPPVEAKPITREKKSRKINAPEVEPENQKGEEPEANLCVKVPLSLRRHWVGMAKMQGTTMTAVIMDALEAKFGKPPQ